MMRTAVAIPAIRMAAMMTIGVSAVEGKRPCPGRMMRMAEAHRRRRRTAAMMNPIPRKTAVLRRQAARARQEIVLDHYEKGREADVAGSEGVPETGNDGDKDEPSGESEPADAVGDTGSQGQEAPAGE
ncbi:MAG: hypothetical protein ACOX3O_02550 [bacterium]